LQRRRLNLDVALWNIKHLTVAPFILAGFMLTNGIANFFYMQNAFIVHTAGGDETPEQAHEHTLSIIILALLVAIGTFAQASVCWANRRVSICFRNCLEIYVFFMLKFEETPRSRVAKKYIPPMDVLQEETCSNYADTVLSGSMRNQVYTQNVSY
jgi:hypothetical protein